MATNFYDRAICGAMKQHTIVTVVRTAEDVQRHDDKVNKFNEENNVFFNQSSSHDKSEEKGLGLRLVTTCLYANGARK
jgi:ribosomal protein L14